jgi:signal peptidase I
MKKLLPRIDFFKLINIVFKIAFFIWFICLIGSIFVLFYVVGVRKELFDKTPNIFAFSFIGLFLLGCLSFLIAVVSLAIYLILKSYKKKQSIFIFFIKLFLVLMVFPLYLIIKIIQPINLIKKITNFNFFTSIKSFKFRPFLRKTFFLLFTIFIFLPVWIFGYLITGVMIQESLGYLKEPIPIAGTGSMFPTFPKGEGKDPKKLGQQIVGQPGMIRYPNGVVIFGKRFLNYEVGRGDIVVVENKKIIEMTKKMYGTPSGWVKRVIAVEGDTIELRGGIVYLNGNPLKEPYTAKPRSTFGQSFLKECKKVTVPKKHIFVMGDNRKESGDSREIGFIEIEAVSHILPLKDQKGDLAKNWRDTEKDFDESSKIKLDKENYLNLLNQKRKEFGVKELIYQPKLELSAKKRGEIILKFNDFSFEATKSGYTMLKAMIDANYSNIVYGEIPIEGYYEAEELIENQFQFPKTKEFLTDKKFQEIGISEVEGKINNCPTQLIIQHFAGYVPPNYSKEVIESWKKALERLKEIQPGWLKLREYNDFYEKHKQYVDRINEIISLRINNISIIVSKMEANQWLNDQEKRMVEADESLANEQDEIAKRLNSEN